LPRVACAPKRYAVGRLSPYALQSSRFAGTPCAMLTTPNVPGGSRVLVTTASVESPARWAPGTERDAALAAGRLRVRGVQVADGSRFDDHLVDEHWSRPCTLRVSGDGNVTCVPKTVGFPSYREGATCIGPPVFESGACDDPAFVLTSVSNTPVALGGVYAGAMSTSGMGCRKVAPASTLDGPDVYYEAGAPLGADAILPVAPWKVAGTGRLRLRGLPADDGSLFSVPNWVLFGINDVFNFHDGWSRYFDSTTAKNCSPVRAPDGVVRCVPTLSLGFPQSVGFSDDKCTKPVFLCPAYVACTGQTVVTMETGVDGEAKGLEVGAAVAVTGTGFSMLASGDCAPGGPFGSGSLVYSRGPTATTWADFPAIPERNGPK
jgi:hypothetical protein